MAPIVTAALEADAVTGEVIRRISSQAPRLELLARRHLARLTPDRWTIEWHLPSWLGRRFNLDPALVEALLRGNVLGLLAIRLEDDLEDGDVRTAEIADSRALAGIALDGAIAEYRAWFGEASAVWPFLHRSIAEWRAGASGRDLAVRGAPMKIAGHAACISAARPDLWPPLERCLDGAVTALVLYDQFCDWEVDLAAGRWNAFVATAVGADQVPTHGDHGPVEVLTAMLTRDVVREHFDLAVRSATEAGRLAADLEVTELAEFLRSWAARTSEQGVRVAEHYQRTGDQATRLFFATRIGGARP